ncbi:little elongation complex subunit 1 [Hoplias malabaricus]|uniref:little elongation complex subunit 1 n=1 Tax=Hoplias malabaricus TaxID=27720 RepID=UPI0034630E4F
MMPGEKQPETGGGLATEAPSGTCENCIILTRSLDEYVAALLSLKQKIIDTDQLLSEYKEKCDELQNSQRECSKLHKQLEEVLLKLGPLEKQIEDYEATKATLEETKTALKSCQQKSEEVDGLREEHFRTLALNKKLENDLNKAQDTAQSHSLEYAKLKTEMETLEGDLQKTQDSLKVCQEAAEELEDLRMQNARTLVLKSGLENQLLALEETKIRQNHEITALKWENSKLQENLQINQVKLEKLEKIVNKEKRCSSTQTKLEPKIDKAKVRLLLEELWHCVEPQTTEMLGLKETTDNQHFSSLSNNVLQRQPQPLPVSPCRKQTPHTATSSPAKETKSQKSRTSSSKKKISPEKGKAASLLQEEKSPSKGRPNKEMGRKEKLSLESEELEQRSAEIDRAIDHSVNYDASSEGDSWSSSTDMWEFLDWFKPLPAVLSPMSRSDESDEIDVPSKSALMENSMSNDKDCKQLTKSTEPNPQKDAIITQSVSFSPAAFLKSSQDMNLITIDDSVSSVNQDMEVEEMGKEKETVEDLPCTAAKTDLPNGLERECATVKADGYRIAAESQLNAVENHSEAHSQSVVGDLHNALSSDVISISSDSGQPLVNVDHTCLDTNENSECHSGVKESSDIPPSQERHSETKSERTVENDQSNLSPVATTEESDSNLTRNQNNSDEQKHEPSSSRINGASSAMSSKHEELSDEEEFFDLKRKVRGVFSKPGRNSPAKNWYGVNACMLHSDGQQKSEDQVQQNKEENHQGFSEALPNPENEKDEGSSEDKSITEHTGKSEIPKQDAVTDGHQETMLTQKPKDEPVNVVPNSLQLNDAHDQGDCSKSRESEDLIPTVEKIDHVHPTSPKEHSTDTEESKCNNPGNVSSVAQNSVELSAVGKGENLLPLTAFASRDALVLTPTSESIGQVRIEMGPPLPPVVMPLTATPTKTEKHNTPTRPSVHLPSWLPSEGPLSPKEQLHMSSFGSGLQDEQSRSPCLTTPSPSRGVPSSPLQFGSATPKHAVPVPGRLPTSALNSSSPTTSQENSMQMLDTMYPELSAQARTLNILKGNLGRAGSERGASPPSVNQISGNKTINSSSTAFTKTEQKAKRTGVNMLLPKSAKKLRLDVCSPVPVNATPPMTVDNDQPTDVIESTTSHPERSLPSCGHEQGTKSKPETKANDKEGQISDAIKKLQTSCFDVLPVIRSHVFLGRISEVPVLRDEEKSVISEFSSNQCSAEEFMSAILTIMKEQRDVLKQEFLQSFCRVYTGLCRQRGDAQKAHAFAYSILKENYPEAPKLILFMVTTWPSILSYENALCRAIHTVSKLKAEGEILDFLSKYLHWDKRPPDDIHKMVSSTLKTLLQDVNLTFQKHARYGDDLCPTAWEYIFTLDLLCAHLGWKWTHDHIIGKELWPVMNTWVSQPRTQQTPVQDVCVAAVLRLIGRLGQLGIKEKLCKSVQHVSKAMNLFAKHGIGEGVPWEVQLSAIYTIYDLAPVDPKDTLETLASWRGETTQPVPSGVTSCITQIGCLCRQIVL